MYNKNNENYFILQILLLAFSKPRFGILGDLSISGHVQILKCFQFNLLVAAKGFHYQK